MSGTPINLFNNFVESTGSFYVTSPDAVINDAQINKTYSIGAIMGGDRGVKKMISGGKQINFNTFFETGQRSRFHQPGATQNYAQPQKLVTGRAPWRFIITDMSWNLQTIELNSGGGGPDAMFQQFVDMKRNVEQVCMTDKWDFLESHLWSTPAGTEMESLNGGEVGKMYSMGAFINEYTNGLFRNPLDTTTNFSTIEGIDPSSTDRGQNRFVHNVSIYSNIWTNANSSVDVNRTVIGAFRKMWQKCHFEKPPNHGEFFTNPAYNNQQIFTSPEGQVAYVNFLSDKQDLFVIEGRQDPAYPDPSYNFIPVKYVSALTTALLYPSNVTNAAASTANIAEGTAATTGNRQGPRYYWVNSNFLYPVFHEQYFFLRGKVREHFNDPDTFVVPVRTWGNVICTKRSAQGLIRPGANLYSTLYT